MKSDVLKHPILLTVAEKLGKTPAQVALRWGLQSGHSVLPKSIHEARIKENFDVFDWAIPDDLFAEFSKIEQASSLSFIIFFLLSGSHILFLLCPQASSKIVRFFLLKKALFSVSSDSRNAIYFYVSTLFQSLSENSCPLIWLRNYHPEFSSLRTSLFLSLQGRLVSGVIFVHETLGHYKTVDELWDGET